MNLIRRHRVARDARAVAAAYVRSLDPYGDVPEGLIAQRDVTVYAGPAADVVLEATIVHASRSGA